MFLGVFLFEVPCNASQTDSIKSIHCCPQEKPSYYQLRTKLSVSSWHPKKPDLLNWNCWNSGLRNSPLNDFHLRKQTNKNCVVKLWLCSNCNTDYTYPYENITFLGSQRKFVALIKLFRIANNSTRQKLDVVLLYYFFRKGYFEYHYQIEKNSPERNIVKDQK